MEPRPREPSRRPRSSGRSPRRGRGAAARVLPAPATRGGRAPAGHQLLEEEEEAAGREGAEPGGEEGGRRQEAADAAGSLHTALGLPWRVKAPPGAQRGGRAGRERRPRGGPGRGAARRGASGGGGSRMKRRAGLGGSMRSVVGFLSQRGLHGDPLLTQDFQRRRLRGCRNLYKKDLLGHFGCVNAIEFSNNGGQWLVSGKSTPFPSPRPLPVPPTPGARPPPALRPHLLPPHPPPAVGRLGVRWKPRPGEGGRAGGGGERMSSIKRTQNG